MHGAMEQSVKAGDKAHYYAEKAEAAENNTAISSDDPNAPDKLRAKIAMLEQRQEKMKAVNAYYRKHKTLDGCPDLSADEIAELQASMSRAWRSDSKPFESWALSNNSAVIRTAKERLEKLAIASEMPDEVIPFDGGEIESDSETNRIIVRHDEKPDRTVIDKLKSRGFKWSPQAKAWQRLRSKSALYTAKEICGVE